MPALRWRITISALLGTAIGAFCCFLMHRLHQGARDFTWAMYLSQKLLGHQNPYDTPYEQYPLTAGLIALPFVRLAPETAAGLFYGISSALLAFGLTRAGYHRLLVFLAYPYWVGLLAVQWSPVIAASAFFPLLAFVTMAKPQVGLPVLLTHLNRWGVGICGVFGIASLIVMPKWPYLWFGQMSHYQHFFAILTLPGPLILLALLRYRERDAWLLLLTSFMPQRWFFDVFTLWLVPKSRREITWTVFWSWALCAWRWYHIPHSFGQIGRWTVVFLYLPILAIILLRKPSLQYGSDYNDNYDAAAPST
jgi:hypothetical protein